MNKSLKQFDKLQKLLQQIHPGKLENDQSLQKIIHSALIEQRSPEWYTMRQNLITGSKIATILGTNPYENIYNFIGEELLQKSHPELFPGRDMNWSALEYGICFEDTVKMLFEHINDMSVIDAGLVKHDQMSIAASPDGLVTGMNRKKNQFNKDFIENDTLKYQLLEIKCLYKRRLILEGQMLDIVPKQYYSQMQCQMECTSSNICHFYQAKITEISQSEFQKKKQLDEEVENGEIHAKNILSQSVEKKQGVYVEKKLDIHKNWTMGIVIKLYNRKDDKHEYIHPFSLNLDYDACQTWLKKKLDGIDREQYYLKQDSIKYWRLERLQFIIVEKDPQWLEDAKQAVILYGNVKQLLCQKKYINKFINNRSKYTRLNDLKNIYDELVDDNVCVDTNLTNPIYDNSPSPKLRQMFKKINIKPVK